MAKKKVIIPPLDVAVAEYCKPGYTDTGLLDANGNPIFRFSSGDENGFYGKLTETIDELGLSEMEPQFISWIPHAELEKKASEHNTAHQRVKKSLLFKATAGTIAALLAGYFIAVNNTQAAAKDLHWNKDYTEALLVNCAFNGVMAGIGAMTRGEPFGPSFKKAFIHAGPAAFAGKYLVGSNPDLVWPAKIINAYGTSITNNLVNGRDMFEKYTLRLGPLTFDMYDGNTQDIELRYNTGVIRGILWHIEEGNSFDLDETLKQGLTPIFRSKRNDDYLGVSANGAVALTPESDKEVLAHELVHVFQQNDFAQMGDILLNNITKRGVPLKEDIPENWDVAPQMGIFPRMLYHKSVNYRNRPEEREAYLLDGK